MQEKPKDFTHINVDVVVEFGYTVDRVCGGDDEVHWLGIGHQQTKHLGILREKEGHIFQ